MNLNRFYRTLGGVPRWSIVRLSRQQNVLEHTALVAMYAYDIAQIIDYDGDIGELLVQCLQHDLPEVETGDLPSPVKSAISNKSAIGEYEDDIMRRRFGVHTGAVDAKMHEILKVADLLEGVLKLTEELTCGNRSVLAVLSSLTSLLFERVAKMEISEEKRDKLQAAVEVAIYDEVEGYDGIRSGVESEGMRFWAKLLQS